MKLNLYRIYCVILITISILPIFIYAQPIQLEDSCWIRKGPNSAHVQSLAIAPSNPDIVYIGTYSTGVYKSIDGGESWTQCSRFNLPEYEDTMLNSPTLPCWWFGDYYPIEDIAIDPNNFNHVWIGTAERGLFESVDGGNSWIKANSTLPDTLAVNFININPNNPDNILLGTGRYFTVGSPQNGGLYRTDNGGISWQLVEDIPYGDTYFVTGITRNPSNNDHLYVGIYSAGEPGFSKGLLESIDNGITWQICTDYLPVHDVVVNPDNNDSLWGISYSGFGYYFLSYSLNGGYIWEPYTGFANPELWVVSLYADPDFNMYIQRANEETGEYNILKSEDHGVNWGNTDYPTGRFNTISLRNKFKASPTNSNETFFGTYYGVSYSDDGGDSAVKRNSGLMNSYIYDVEVHQQNPEIIYAGGLQGLWKSVDYGHSWLCILEASVMHIAIDPSCPDTLYFGSGSNLYRSFDACVEIENIYDGLYGGITDISINPKENNTIYVGTGLSEYNFPLFKSNDYGSTWEYLYTSGHNCSHKEIAIDFNFPDTIYFCRDRSIDGGQTWELSYLDEFVVGIHPYNSNTIYATDGFANHLYVSYDFGQTFEEIAQYPTGPFPGGNISSFTVYHKWPDYLFYTTLNDGVYYSSDGGSSWFKLEGNYNSRALDIIPIINENKYIIATHGDGVWVYDTSLITRVDPKFNFKSAPVFNVYPNPFTDRVTIFLEPDKPEIISIHVYDVFGKKVCTLLSHELIMGNYSIYWDGKDKNRKEVKSGLYLIQLSIGDNIYSKKVIHSKFY